MLIPIGIVVLFYLDGRTNIAPGPQLIFVESWPAEPHRRGDQGQAEDRPGARARPREERASSEFQQLDESLSRIGI